MAGCENCPDNRYDIYLHDFRTEESRPVAEDEFLKSNPSVYGQGIAWQRFFRPNQADIWWINLNTGVIGGLTETVDSEIRPQLDGDRVLWQVSQDCDVINLGPGGEELTYNTGIYVMDLNDDKPLRLTDYIEPRALIDGDTVVITEGCMAGHDVYHLTLPGS